MSKICFNIGSHELQLTNDLTGKICVLYENKIVSKKRTLGLSSTQHFEVNEENENIKYYIRVDLSFSGLLKYCVKRNQVLVKKGSFSSITIDLLRIFFLLIGFGAFAPLPMLIIFPDSYINHVLSGYSPDEAMLFYTNVGVEFIFGFLFLISAAFLKRILIVQIEMITIILWARICLMLIFSPSNMSYLLQNYDHRIGLLLISLRFGFIWLFWFLLENSKALAKELKSQPSLQNNPSI